MEPRRAVGLSAFVFIVLHGILVLSLYFSWDVQMLLSFQPLQFGAAAAVIVVLIAAVSNGFALAKLGRWRKRIQQLNYIVFALAFTHFFFTGMFAGGPREVNPAEYILPGIGILTVLMQVAGFIVRRSKTRGGRKKSRFLSVISSAQSASLPRLSAPACPRQPSRSIRKARNHG